MHFIINPPISGFPGFHERFQGFQGFHERFLYFNEDFRISGKITRDFSEVYEISVSGGPLDYVATLTAHAHIQRKKYENDHVPSHESVSLVPRPHPQEEARVRSEEVRQEAKPDVIYRTRYDIPGILPIELHTLAYWYVRFSFFPDGASMSRKDKALLVYSLYRIASMLIRGSIMLECGYIYSPRGVSQWYKVAPC